MTLHTLIQSATWAEVSEALTRIYGDFAPLSVCEKAFNELLATEPVKSDMRIRVKLSEEEGGNPVVSGHDSNRKRWALDFVPWPEWLGMELSDMIWSKTDILAICIWEMTFYGSSNEMVQNTSNKLMDSMRDEAMKWERGED